jgi:sugar O-acyltransferase (sialic acid O-acetyltransferase NeuD family)
MLLYGAGGHAKVIFSGLLAQNLSVNAIFDDFPGACAFADIPFVGRYHPQVLAQEEIIIAIGNNLTRRKIAGIILHRPGQFIHHTAISELAANVGLGSVVLQHAVLQTHAAVGNFVIINTGAIVEHDCIIGDFVHVAPGAIICGNVKVGENTLIGAGSVLAPNLQIGANCLIAAGSVVTRNIPDYAIVRGNPGRIIKIGKDDA